LFAKQPEGFTLAAIFRTSCSTYNGYFAINKHTIVYLQTKSKNHFSINCPVLSCMVTIFYDRKIILLDQIGLHHIYIQSVEADLSSLNKKQEKKKYMANAPLKAGAKRHIMEINGAYF